MKKHEVQICYGTACYLLGAAELLKIEELLPEDVRDSVHITVKPCLGLCEREQVGKAPYALVDGEAMAEATLEKIIAKVAEK